MSKVNIINYKRKSIASIQGKHHGVPIFYSVDPCHDDIYMLIRDLSDTKNIYKKISLSNGHVQTSEYFNSVYDFFEKYKDKARFYDIEITANEI
jgi:hypothetical protein